LQGGKGGEEESFKIALHGPSGKTVGLIGLGNVARRVADILAKGFQMKVIAFDEWIPDAVFEQLSARRCADIKGVIENADFVNISVPLNDSTRNMISDEQFNWFKPDAI
jgi:D-3-phosphoglycerate dehydrogenase